MPPRLQCLNAIIAPSRAGGYGKVAAFSTASRALAAEKPISSAFDLLTALTRDTPHNTSTSGQPTPVRHPHRGRTGGTNFKLPPGNSTSNSRVLNLVSKHAGKHHGRGPTSAASIAQELKNHKLASDLTKQIPRRWKAGDVYSPHDLSPVEMEKWKRRGKPERDVVDVLKLDIVGEYKNFSIMSEYMTPMGRIKPAAETGLRKVNQRKMAKAIRRSVGLGLMPSVHRHPEILYKQMARARDNVGRFRV